jgi:WD40 repeat protein/class 3 adenylate cyclase/tRNA A-37 threonylcarbamoyl transferase component Bud32
MVVAAGELQQIAIERRAKVQEFQRSHRVAVLTLVFTDIVGSTKLKQELGDQEAVSAILRHHAAVREILSRFGQGEEVETAGDSFFIVFTNPSDAVKFSLFAQARLRAMAAENGHPIFDRIGIHVGEVLVEEDGDRGKAEALYGIQVDTCARVQSLAEGDQILLTRFAFDEARRSLSFDELNEVDPLSWLNHGPYLLKGVEEPIEICEVGELGKAKLGRPPDTEKAHRFISADGEPVLGWRPAVGQQVPGTSWVLEKKLGEGGFGEVWLGRDKRLKTDHVFKFCFRADRVRSLKREVTLFRLLKERVGEHPNIVGIEHVYFDEAPFYIVMQHVEGKDLATWCETQGGVDKVPPAARIEIVAQIADALQAAHDSGVIHRDVKPSNILVDGRSDIHAYLTDFGIGQVVSKEVLSRLTHSGFTQTIEGSSSRSGTQLYMAPELFSGRPASIRSDIYALGVVLYQLVVGDFARAVTTDWAKQITDGLLREDLGKCFAGDPQERFAGARQLAEQLRSLEERRAAFDRQQAILKERERAAYRRGTMRTAALALVVIGLLAWLAIYAFVQRHEAQEQTKEASAQRKAAEESALRVREYSSRLQEQLARAQIEEGRAWVERAKVNAARGNNFAAAMMAARALGFAGFGREKIVDPKFNEEYPILLSAANDPIDEQEARQEINEAALIGYFGRPLWQTPVFRQHEGPVLSLAWSPDGKILASGSGDKTVKLWETATGKLLTSLHGHTDAVWSVAWSPDGKTLASGSGDQTVKLWEAATGKLLTSLQGHTGQVIRVAWSPDGKTLASGSTDQTVKLWEAATGRLLTSLQGHTNSVFSVAWSPDGKTLASGSRDQTVNLWEAATGKLLTSLQGHTGEVYSVAWSPDGKTLTSASGDQTVKLWEVATGKLLTNLKGHTGQVWSAAWSPDGKTLASGSGDQTVKLWEAATGKLLTSLQGHTAAVYAVAWSPDGKILASGAGDQTVKLWEAGTGKLLARLQGHTDAVYSVAWSPDGKTLATGSRDKTVRLWDLAMGKLLAILQGHTDSVLSVAWSPDGKTLASGSFDQTLKLWNPATGKLLAALQGHTGAVYSVAWSPDGKTLASGSADKTVKLWDPATGKLLTTLPGHTAAVYCLAWSPDGKTLASGAGDQTVKLWDPATGKLLTSLQGHTGELSSVAWSPDGKTLASGSRDQTVKLWEAATGKLLASLQGHTDSVWSVAWSPDGKTLASGSSDQTVKLWEAATGKPLVRLQGHTDTVWSVAWGPDGKTLASASTDRTMMLWETSTGELLTSLHGHSEAVRSVAWSPDGKTLASGSYDHTVKLWDAATAKLVTSLQGHTSGVYSVAWSPDGKTLASGSDDLTVKLWEAATGKLLTSLQGHTGPVCSVAWSPDGKTLASGSVDQTVKLWDPATGKLLTSLQGHTDSVWSVAWSPDGKILVSGSRDQTVKLWDTATGKLLTSLKGHTGPVCSIAWSPDGRTLASASYDHTVNLWDAATGKLVKSLQGHASGVYSVAWSPDGETLASASDDRSVKLWEAATGRLLASLQGHTATVWSVAWSPDGKTLASSSIDHTVKIWEGPGSSEIDLAEYLRSRWIRLVGSETVWEMNKNLLSDRSFDVFNVRGTTLLGIERSGSVGSQKLSEELCLLLRTGNCAEAIAIGNGTLAEAADLPIREMLLAALSASAADDLFSNTTWRGIWLTEQMEPMITSEAMLDPAVSLGMLHLGTQLALAGSDEANFLSVRERFNARIAGMAPRFWFVALGRNLLAAATETDAPKKERQAAVDQLRLLTNQLPDSAELRQQLTEALQKLGSQ